ncbi:hypothetical protein AURDEDRAFT_114867 [Auricularia subglabra TFB-10046 SS5]|nr:hypothetical protein AURDEDRAFT_114867 [Auricularia subglabra TFB-10046 SS5]
MPSSEPFTVSALPPADFWRKPGAEPINLSNASRKTKPVALASLKRVRVTVRADWARQYDQGGLIIVAPGAEYWVKCGIEFYNGVPCVSCVATDAWSDWSVVPGLVKGGSVTIELAPAEGSLWLYLVGEDGAKTALREITWFLTKKPDVVADVGMRSSWCTSRTSCSSIESLPRSVPIVFQPSSCSTGPDERN